MLYTIVAPRIPPHPARAERGANLRWRGFVMPAHTALRGSNVLE
jgi:hypothetical protein